MSNNFITNNEPHQTLTSRINTLLSISEELKFLAGFFYLFGWHNLKNEIKQNPDLVIKILVGLKIDKYLNKIIEIDSNKNLSIDDKVSEFLDSLIKSINNHEMDTQEVYQDFSFLLELIKQDRIKIRKTQEPNHAKLYLFKFNQNQSLLQNQTGSFITGSSNLTKAGLESQQEFNIEIKDYGFEEATNYFDDLWEDSILITENEENKKRILEALEYKTLVANITPFEAYTLILKTYLDLQQQKKILPTTENLLEQIGYKKYKFQLDAVNQALNIIEEYNGCLIADVVGLGKSIIACLIAKNLNLRGVIICPPGLIENWKYYKNEFKLHHWEIQSKGKLNDFAENINNQGIDVVIIDEAHSFRNPDTANYESLSIICNARKVILLTATPFNNSPEDIFALLKLFIITGKSAITLDDNLATKFKDFKDKYKKLGDILKNYNSNDRTKEEKAQKKYKEFFKNNTYDEAKVYDELKKISKQVKEIISPLVIRRNRLDLLKDFEYKEEITSFSEIADPQLIYFELSQEQNKFYDEIIQDFDKEKRLFTGAIYQPFKYKRNAQHKNDDFTKISQENLFDFMRRLLIRRFESSFGAFKKSIDTFLKTHEIVRDFIKNNNKYILDRGLIKKWEEQDLDEEAVNKEIEKYKNDEMSKKSKDKEIYKMSDSDFKDHEFIQDIEKDIELFKKIKDKLEELKFINDDPKVKKIINQVKDMLNKEPDRKIIIFSEYVATINHIENHIKKYFNNEDFPNKILVCTGGKLGTKDLETLEKEFNAQYDKEKQTNNYQILLSTDKLSEGFNLNRAGVIINYDIPWNPTKVIQRLGRINRIGSKVYEKLYIINSFPSVKGAEHVKIEDIAKHKMFMIHNILGEDAKIFDVSEIPDEAKLFTKINQNPNDYENEENIITKIRNEYNKIKDKYPKVIEKINKLPNRVKTAKSSDQYQLNILHKKGLALFYELVDDDNIKKEIYIDEFLKNIQCDFNEPGLKLSDKFWEFYQNNQKESKINTAHKKGKPKNSTAIENLKSSLNLKDISEENKKFANILIDDLTNYFTLSQNTIKMLSKKNILDINKNIKDLKNKLGIDYLNKIKKQLSNIKQEIIICVENINRE